MYSLGELVNSPRGFYYMNLIKNKNIAVQLKMISKQNNIATPPQIKYYPCAVSQGTINLERVAHIISSRSSLSIGDCDGVLWL
jgi:hypothetical protein